VENKKSEEGKRQIEERKWQVEQMKRYIEVLGRQLAATGLNPVRPDKRPGSLGGETKELILEGIFDVFVNWFKGLSGSVRAYYAPF